VSAESGGQGAGRLLRPESIAIVGVSPEPDSIGGAVLANLERFNYGGQIHLVSRSRDAIGGRPCLPAIDELPEGVDAAVLALPQAGIAEAVASCIKRKIGAAVIFAAGFAEIGDAGRVAQDKLARAAKAGGLALQGPNCIGFVNYADGVPLTYEPVTPAQPDGPAVAVAAQSGAMASSLRAAFQAKGLAVAQAISTGNEAGLCVEDFLEFLVGESNAKAIALFVEQIRQPKRFLELAARARQAAKAIVLLHPGRGARAKDSARSHTGALAGDYAVMETLLRRQAVALVETVEELIDVTEILARFPQAPVKGAAIVTNSGAFKGFALDFCESIGLDLPAPSAATVAALKKALPPFASIDNPLDVTGQLIKEPAILPKSVAPLLADAAFGSLVVAVVPGGPQQAAAKVQALLPAVAGSVKPVAVATTHDEGALPAEFIPAIRGAGLPFFRSPERALRAMARVTALGRARAAAGISAPPIKLSAAKLPGKGALAEYQGKDFLVALGFRTPRGALVRDVVEAKNLAARLGYPVALKAQSAALPHKSEAGGVILGLADATALAQGWEKLNAGVHKAHPRIVLDGVLVEAMAEPGIEMAVGARRDKEWGPVLMVALGGVWIEALKDIRLMPVDLDAQDIEREILSLKGAALLKGMRGRPAADVPALVEAMLRLGSLMQANPAIVEIDINPLTVYAKGKGVLVLDALIVSA
jgi:acyl-CoA synthetase (NDP forming)